jgi:hypothetical protein
MKPRTTRTAQARRHGLPRVVSPLPPAGPGADQNGIGIRAPHPDAELRRAMIAEAAYYRAEQRGFEPGRDLEDWCAAEIDIDSQLVGDESPSACGQ